MKTLVTLALCSALMLTGNVGNTRPAAAATHDRRVNGAHRPHKSKAPRAKTRSQRRARGTLAQLSDELILSPNLVRQLQANLIDGGYLAGTIDGSLTRRTRRALAEFQREYHLPGTGSLDRATAEALLGHDLISAFLVAGAVDQKR